MKSHLPFVKTTENYLSYNVAVIQWITSCHKNRMTTHVITLWGIHIMSFTTSVSAVCFLLEILSILKAIKSNFNGSYDKQNLHWWSFHIKFTKLDKASFHKFHIK